MTAVLAPVTATLAAGDLEATFVPSLGMAGTSLRHAGEELLHVDEPALTGIPLPHPWANRLRGDRYVVDGRAVVLPHHSSLVRREERDLPIHGLLLGSPHWEVLEHAESRLRLACSPRGLNSSSSSHSRTCSSSTSASRRAR